MVAGRSVRTVSGRALVLLIVIALHVGFVISLSLNQRRQVSESPATSEPLIVFFIDEPKQAQGETVEPARRATRPGEATSRSERRPPPSTEEQSSTAITVDWALEAKRAAADQIEKQEEDARRRRALTGRDDSGLGVSSGNASPPDSIWESSQAQRVEGIKGGGLLLHLGERCGIAFVGLAIMPGCTLGQREARGDLFNHMKADKPDDAKLP